MGQSLAKVTNYGLLTMIFAGATGSFTKVGLGTYAWGLIYLATLVVAFRDRDALVAAITSSWPLLLFPILSAVSLIWSVDTASTLRAAAQYFFTAVIALWIGSTFRLPTLHSALCLALLGCVFASIVATYFGVIDGFKQDDFVGAERYFIGLHPQKNIMGNVIVYASLVTLIYGAIKNKLLLAYCIAIALLPPLLLTKSTTALLLYFMILSYGPVLWFVTRVHAKTQVVLSLTLVTLIALFVLLAFDVGVIQHLFAAIGKDTTLTGRTTIWSMAMQVFQDSPYLGVGYQAFWKSSQYANEVLQIRAAILDSIGGFHNGYLEALVGLGVPGLLAYVLMILNALVATGRLAAQQLSASSLGALYIIAHIFCRTFTESTLYGQHDLQFILLVALAVAAKASLNKARANG